MKKFKIIAVALVFALVLAACGKKDEVDIVGGNGEEITIDVDTEIEGTALDFFPFLENTQYVYSRDSIFADREEHYVTFVNGNNMQRKVMVANYEATEVFEFRDGAIVMVYAESEWYDFNDLTESERNFDRIILKGPLKVGTTWEVESGFITLGNLTGTSTITAVNVPITTPAGDFLAIEVTIDFPGSNYSINYFARGVGLIKTEYYTKSHGHDRYASNTIEETIIIEEFNRNVSHQMALNVYFADVDDYFLDFSEVILELRTNDSITLILERALREKGLFSENTKINNIEVNNLEKYMLLDLSSEFYTERTSKLGSGFETAAIEEVALTFMEFFDVWSISITMDGEPYSGGHVDFDENHFIERGNLLTANAQRRAED